MLEIDSLDRRPALQQSTVSSPNSGATATSTPGNSPNLSQGYGNYLRPIETPLAFNGFSEETLRRFGFSSPPPVRARHGHWFGFERYPAAEPLEPGSAVSAVLVRGDMDIAATCTVTYVDPQRLLACGHPLMQFGSVDIPMNKAQVLATLPSPLNAFKIVNTTESVGSFVQDRHTGILGMFGKEPDMIPVTLTIHGGPSTKEFHYEVLNNAKLSPVAMMATVFNALRGTNEYGEETTYRMNGIINVQGYQEVALQNMFAPTDNGQPAAALAALMVGDRFGRIYDNPYDIPKVRGVKLDFDLVRERRWARLESARTDVTEARPGDEIVVEAVLRPYIAESASSNRSQFTFQLPPRRAPCAFWSVMATRSTVCAADFLQSAASWAWLPPSRF